MLLKKLEERADELIDHGLRITFEGTRTVVVPGTKDEPGYTETVDDEKLQLEGTKYFIDHLFGKSVQRNELTGGDVPVEIDLTPSPEKAAAIAAAMKEAGL